jgi:hypothetical protein
MQSDETMHSGWGPLRGFGDHAVASVQAGDSNVYAIDTHLNVYSQDGKSIPTNGYEPINLHGSDNTLWMTTTRNGDTGNVFSRIENPDSAALQNSFAPLDAKRDAIVEGIKSTFNQQTDVLTIRKQADDIIGFFKKIFALDKHTSTKANNQVGHLQNEVQSIQVQLDQMKKSEPFLKILVISLGVVVLIYLTVSGWIAHVLSLVVVGVGVFFAIQVSNG